MWSNGANLTVYLQDAGSHTRITLDCAQVALIESPISRKRDTKHAEAFMNALGGTLDAD